MPFDIRARSWMGHDPGFSRALAAHGWVGMTLPVEYGGQGRSYFARFVVVEELLAASVPVGAHWVAERQSGPLILHYGTEAQRRFYLPRICRGEAFFCIGMSEPDSGSDLASVRCRATRTDTGWLLNGAKIWTTYADGAHYMIALIRTSGSGADRQQGLSQLIIDLSLPGITVKPIVDLAGDSHFCEVHFDNVRLSSDALIGEEGQGWEQCVAELSLERSGPERFYSSILVLDLWLAPTFANKRRPTSAQWHLLAVSLVNLRYSVPCRSRLPVNWSEASGPKQLRHSTRIWVLHSSNRPQRRLLMLSLRSPTSFRTKSLVEPWLMRRRCPPAIRCAEARARSCAA